LTTLTTLPTSPPRLELRSTTVRGLAAWIRGLLGRGDPRARVVAPPRLHLGQRLEVEWGVDCPARNLAGVSVSLVGTEIAHQRISARTGISIVSETSVFCALEIARAGAQPGVPVALGRGGVLVPAATVPTLAGRHNEIAWAIVVEASFEPAAGAPAAPGLRESFPIVLLAGAA
jgi:hypothetical protein